MVDSVMKIIEDALDKLESMWSEWQLMPSPENCRSITGPKNSGVYQIRNKQTGNLILFGSGKKCQKRMKSLFPPPHGTGTRNNLKKRNHVLDYWRNQAVATCSGFSHSLPFAVLTFAVNIYLTEH
jgi:hypothetical protein